MIRSLDALMSGKYRCRMRIVRVKKQSKGDEVHDGRHSIHRPCGELKEALNALVVVCDELHAKEGAPECIDRYVGGG